MQKTGLCGVCGETRELSHTFRDGNCICKRCEMKISDGFNVPWERLSVSDLHYFDELPLCNDNFPFDFEFEGFRANTKSGVFAVKYHNQLFRLNTIRKYYIKFHYGVKRGTGMRGDTKEVKYAKLVIEIDHPVISSIEHSLSRDKEGVISIFDPTSMSVKNAYSNHNTAIFQFLQKVTGLPLSMPLNEGGFL